MDRREFLATPLILAGCGMDVELQPSPLQRTSKNVFGSGVLGRWEPTMTFAVSGDLSVVYGAQSGDFVRFGSLVFIRYFLSCTPTYATAAGGFIIQGMPFDNSMNGIPSTGAVYTRNITIPASHDYLVSVIANASDSINMNLYGIRSGNTPTFLTTTHVASGVAIDVNGEMFYMTNKAT